jgi:hypothetical protein
MESIWLWEGPGSVGVDLVAWDGHVTDSDALVTSVLPKPEVTWWDVIELVAAPDLDARSRRWVA